MKKVVITFDIDDKVVNVNEYLNSLSHPLRDILIRSDFPSLIHPVKYDLPLCGRKVGSIELLEVQ